MQLKRHRRRWTEEEINYLELHWGSKSRKRIAKTLGRSENAVILKAQKLGLGNPLTHINGITISQLSKVLNTDYAILKNWIAKYGMPAKRKVVALEKKVLYITYEDFWKWAEKHKQMIDFSRMERLSLGPEPKWAEEKRKADELTKLRVPKPHNTPWSKEEDEKLKWMLKQFKYTYPEIAEELQRSQGAVKRRIINLGLKERPVQLYSHIKYTREEEKLIVGMLEKGYCFEEIASRLGNHRSALGVRGKAERMGYKFKNGVPYKPKEVS